MKKTKDLIASMTPEQKRKMMEFMYVTNRVNSELKKRKSKKSKTK